MPGIPDGQWQLTGSLLWFPLDTPIVPPFSDFHQIETPVARMFEYILSFQQSLRIRYWLSACHQQWLI